jgi:hypothetical protein
MLQRTREAMAFPDAAVKRAGDVLVGLLDSDNEKERRLAAERIRDERGLTRVVKPTEHAQLVVILRKPWEADANVIEQPPTRASFPLPEPEA